MKNYTSFKSSILFLMFVQLACPVSFSQTFTKITTGAIVNTPGDSRSVNWIDVNGDGFIDCMITNGPAGGQNNFLYINNGAGGFTPVTNDTIVADHQPSDGATWADTDNDGDPDCYVANWYATNNLFYTNNGSGMFTQLAGTVVISGGYCETASWGDYDNDGLVDLYLTNSAGLNKNLLFHNDGNNAFTKITSGPAVNDINDSRCVNWTDADIDGDLDLFVTNESSQNEIIYRNDGGGLFTKLTTGDLLTNAGNTMSGSWADYDNDGDLDVFLSNDGSSNALFRNDGNFNFTKITGDTVSNTNAHSFSSAWSDIDNDGDLDLFVTNSFYTTTLQLNFLYLNNGNGSFTRVNNTPPATDSSWSYGCAFGDYDNDGFEDLAVATVRFNSIDPPDLIYHNDGNSNNWITITLVGTLTSKSAIGTKIRVKALINGVPVWQLREISAQTSYCGENDLRAHFGLGNATVIDSIKVEWLSGAVENYATLSTGQFITITEGQGITGIAQQTPGNDFTVFPNPSKGMITVTAAKSLLPGDKIIFTNAHGDTLNEINIKSAVNSVSLDIQNVAENAGVYFIVLITKSGIVTKKIVRL